MDYFYYFVITACVASFAPHARLNFPNSVAGKESSEENNSWQNVCCNHLMHREKFFSKIWPGTFKPLDDTSHSLPLDWSCLPLVLPINSFVAENVVWVIGLNGTCLLMLLVFVEPPRIPPRSRPKQDPSHARRAPPSAAIKRISKYASSNQERRQCEKKPAVKRLEAFSVVPLLRPKPFLGGWGGVEWGETPHRSFCQTKNTARVAAHFSSSNPRTHITEAPPLAGAVGRTLKLTFLCSKILLLAQTSTVPKSPRDVCNRFLDNGASQGTARQTWWKQEEATLDTSIDDAAVVAKHSFNTHDFPLLIRCFLHLWRC